MKAIHKFPLNFGSSNQYDVDMPKGADVLHAEILNNQIFIWARVNTNHKLKKRQFMIFGTGQELVDYDKKHYHYIRTMISGGLVWHLYEVLE